MDNIIGLFLEMHASSFEQPNRMAVLLRRLDSNFGEKIEHFYKEQDAEGKLESLSCLVKFIYKKSHGKLPMRWVLKS